ncbi:hypothetical protein ACKVMT_09570 [Halobacteriales archaeon Cl-PHB]
MDKWDVLAGLLVFAGLVLPLFGLAVGDQANYSLYVEDQVVRDQIEEESDIIEYDYLSPDQQDAFRTGLETDESVSLSPPTDAFDDRYVHYRDVYYRTLVAHGDAAQGTMFFSSLGGLGLITVGGSSWLFRQFWNGNADRD